jgi:anaerobic ribonucleoside-triphosphate reductase activating protein
MTDALIQYHSIISDSMTDGPHGPRTVLFMQGCSIRCKGCQNRSLWTPGGTKVAPLTLARRLVTPDQPITITGGEPTDQPLAFSSLMVAIRWFDIHRHVIVYTGRTIEDLLANHRQAMVGLLLAHVVVDGPFIQDQDDDHLQWRGSRNQRPIDMTASLQALREAGLPLDDLPDHLHLADWDQPHLMFTPQGTLGAAGLIDELAPAGGTPYERRCGTTP